MLPKTTSALPKVTHTQKTWLKDKSDLLETHLLHIIFYKGHKFYTDHLPMEYFAFFGDEMIMYCCSAGLVTPLPPTLPGPPVYLGELEWAGGAELVTV